MGLRWNKNECYGGGGGGGGFIPLYRFAVNKQTNKQTIVEHILEWQH